MQYLGLKSVLKTVGEGLFLVIILKVRDEELSLKHKVNESQMTGSAS